MTADVEAIGDVGDTGKADASGNTDPRNWPAFGTPDAVALESPGQTWTWAEVSDAADALAETLRGLPAVAGRPRVAHVFDLRPEAVVAVHAIARAEAVVAMGHIDWADDQCDRFAGTVDPSAVLIAPDHEWPGPWARRAVALPGFGPVDLLTPLEGIRHRHAAPEGTDVLVSTSGSMGVPRVVCHSWAGLGANAVAANRRGGVGPASSTLATLAWGHVGGLAIIVRAGQSGGRIVCATPRFDAAGAAEALERHRVTHASVVPVMLERLLASGDPVPDSLEQVLVGGAAVVDELLRRAVAAGWPVSPTYGLTEAGSQVATIAPRSLSSPRVEAAHGGTGLGLLDQPLDGFEIDVDEGGEVAIRGPAMMVGVLGGEPWRRDAWYPTGDIAARDDAGALDIVGRRADRIVTGGSNVDPEEVETIVGRHPGVADVCVVGVPDERWGDIVTAVVVPSDFDAADPATDADAADQNRLEALARDLAAWARQHLHGPRMPRRWRFVEHLPRNANGKVDRRAVRAGARREQPT